MLNHRSHGSKTPEELKALIAQSLDADKAEDITIIPLDEQSALADYIIIASGTSSRHVSALASKLKKRLEIEKIKGIEIEGLARCDWVAMDIGDVIVHLFRPEVRDFYNMEKMWGAPSPNTNADNALHA